MNLKIQGLIAKKKDDDNLTEAELQAKRDSFAAYIKGWKSEQDSNLDQVKAQYSGMPVTRVANSGNTSEVKYMTGIDPYINQPYIGDPLYPGLLPQQQPWEWTNPGPFPQPEKKYGPSPSRSGSSTQDMAEYLQQMLKPQKSEFEVLLDAMFDTAEKEQFLVTLGFEFLHEDGEDWMKREVAGLTEKCKKSDCFDKIFLREMTIKFKNLLISKNSLKLKI